MKITLENTYRDVRDDKCLEGISKYFYYGINDLMLNAQIKEAGSGIWPNEQSVKAINFYAELKEQDKLAIYYPQGENNYSNIIHLKQDKRCRVAVVTAGGAYSAVCNGVEAMPVTQRLYELGFDVFLFTYHILEESYKSIDDLGAAIKFIHEHKEELNVDVKDYICIGFSAAGHVVGEFGTNNHGYKVYGLPKPGLLGLCYPVIDMGEYGHEVSRNNFLGNNSTKEKRDEYSVQKHVDDTYPKTFMWQCLHDSEVDINNSKIMDETLTKNNIPHIYETFDHTAHGWGIATGKLADGWVDRLVEFYKAN